MFWLVEAVETLGTAKPNQPSPNSFQDWTSTTWWSARPSPRLCLIGWHIVGGSTTPCCVLVPPAVEFLHQPSARWAFVWEWCKTSFFWWVSDTKPDPRPALHETEGAAPVPLSISQSQTLPLCSRCCFLGWFWVDLWQVFHSPSICSSSSLTSQTGSLSKLELQRHLMSDWPKVHVFLGAPPAPTGLDEEAVPKKNGEERHHAAWRHVALRRKEGRLGAEPGEAFRDQSNTLFSFILIGPWQLLHNNSKHEAHPRTLIEYKSVVSNTICV